MDELARQSLEETAGGKTENVGFQGQGENRIKRRLLYFLFLVCYNLNQSVKGIKLYKTVNNQAVINTVAGG